ncbi:hypothetical protein BDZ97DRAFT_1837415 [Flammula alnicola]|nr:hypothetical protein BDZ97DRAFT_1837415 [Flammula alnicola]
MNPICPCSQSTPSRRTWPTRTLWSEPAHRRLRVLTGIKVPKIECVVVLGVCTEGSNAGCYGCSLKTRHGSGMRLRMQARSTCTTGSGAGIYMPWIQKIRSHRGTYLETARFGAVMEELDVTDFLFLVFFLGWTSGWFVLSNLFCSEAGYKYSLCVLKAKIDLTYYTHSIPFGKYHLRRPCVA